MCSIKGFVLLALEAALVALPPPIIFPSASLASVDHSLPASSGQLKVVVCYRVQLKSRHEVLQKPAILVKTLDI